MTRILFNARFAWRVAGLRYAIRYFIRAGRRSARAGKPGRHFPPAY